MSEDITALFDALQSEHRMLDHFLTCLLRYGNDHDKTAAALGGLIMAYFKANKLRGWTQPNA